MTIDEALAAAYRTSELEHREIKALIGLREAFKADDDLKYEAKALREELRRLRDKIAPYPLRNRCHLSHVTLTLLERSL